MKQIKKFAGVALSGDDWIKWITVFRTKCKRCGSTASESRKFQYN